MKSVRLSCVFAVALLLAAPAFAQAAAPQQANKPMEPSVTKAIGDWTVRCYPVQGPSPCEMAEMRVSKKSGQRVLGVIVAYVPPQNANILQVSVPLGVALANGLVLDTDTFKSQPLKFRRCDQSGCFVEGPFPAEAISQLSRATKAQVHVVSVDGKAFNFVLSMKGFDEAYRTLVELTKQNAKAPAAAPAAADGSEAAPQ